MSGKNVGTVTLCAHRIELKEGEIQRHDAQIVSTCRNPTRGKDEPLYILRKTS